MGRCGYFLQLFVGLGSRNSNSPSCCCCCCRRRCCCFVVVVVVVVVVTAKTAVSTVVGSHCK